MTFQGRHRNVVVENWCYFQERYTFGKEAEILEIFSKKFGKRQFSTEIFYQEIPKILIFFKICLIFGQMLEILHACFLIFHLMEIIHEILITLNSSTNCNRFSS